MHPRYILIFLLAVLPLSARSQDSLSAEHHAVSRTFLFGAGKSALFDAYLSPLDYKGPAASLTFYNERTARWGQGNVISLALFDVAGAYAHNAQKNAHFYDGQLTLDMGWLYRWAPGSRWRVCLGGLAEVSGGGTYSTRNGNNPAQGRVSAALLASFIADYRFPVRRRSWTARVQLDAPLVGVMFSPDYGQSYYEMFTLGQFGGANVRCTYPVNAPSLRGLATLTIPVRHSNLVIGYKGDFRQSDVCNLGRHAWTHAAVIGYTRHLKF